MRAEPKLRGLQASFAMHLQLIRKKYSTDCRAERAIQQVAEFDFSLADVASLEESIQIAKRVLLD